MGLKEMFTGLLKRKTPTPLDKDIYNLGNALFDNGDHVIVEVLI